MLPVCGGNVLPNRGIESIQAIQFVLNHSVAPTGVVIGRLSVNGLNPRTDDPKELPGAAMRTTGVRDFRSKGRTLSTGFRTI